MDNTSIQDILPRINYMSDGTTTEFEIPFKVMNQSFIHVFLDNSEATAGFTVGESSVVFDSAPAAGTNVTIMRIVAVDYLTSMRSRGVLTLELMDQVNTYMIAQMQGLEEKLSRVPTAPVDYTGTPTDLFNNFKADVDEVKADKDIVLQTKVLIEELANEIYSQFNDATANATHIAEEAASLAQAWASQEEGLVDNTDLSAKQYAGKASDSADEARDWAYDSKNILGDTYTSLRMDIPFGKLPMDGSKSVIIDGSTVYYTRDNFPSVVEAIVDGKLKAVDIETFNNLVQVNGWCGVFGYDGVTDTFKTPKVTNSAQIGVIPSADGSNKNLGRILYKQLKDEQATYKTYVDIFTDGWAEHHGVNLSIPNDIYSTITVNYLINYLNNQYNTDVQSVRSAGDNIYFPSVYDKTVSSFTVRNWVTNSNSGGGTWKCSGYTAAPTDVPQQRFFITCYNTTDEVSIAVYTEMLQAYVQDVLIPQIDGEAEAEVQKAKDWAYASKNILGDWMSSTRTDLMFGRLPADGSSSAIINGASLNYTEANFPDTVAALRDGLLMSVDMTTFDNLVQVNGWCGVFGFDETSGDFKTPKVANENQQNIIPAADGSNRNIGRILYKTVTSSRGTADIFTDAWQEEYGQIIPVASGSAQIIQIDFPSPFKDTSYMYQASPGWTASLGECYMFERIEAAVARTKDYVKIHAHGNMQSGWEARGYGETLTDLQQKKFFINCYNTVDENSVAHFEEVLDDYTTNTIIPKIEAEGQGYVDAAAEQANIATGAANSALFALTNLGVLGTLAQLEPNNAYQAIMNVNNLNLSVRAPSDLTKFNQVILQLYISTDITDPTINVDYNTDQFFGGEPPELEAGKDYNIVFEYNARKGVWVVGGLLVASES